MLSQRSTVHQHNPGALGRGRTETSLALEILSGPARICHLHHRPDGLRTGGPRPRVRTLVDKTGGGGVLPEPFSSICAGQVTAQAGKYPAVVKPEMHGLDEIVQ